MRKMQSTSKDTMMPLYESSRKATSAINIRTISHTTLNSHSADRVLCTTSIYIGWMCRRVTYKLSVIVYHCLHGTAPKYLSELCTLVADVASRINFDLLVRMQVLLLPRYKLSGLGRRAFRVAGPLVWNSIADCLRDPALELVSFKRWLKTFLFAR